MRIPVLSSLVRKEMKSRGNQWISSFERIYNCKLEHDLLPNGKKVWYFKFKEPRDATMFILRWS